MTTPLHTVLTQLAHTHGCIFEASKSNNKIFKLKPNNQNKKYTVYYNELFGIISQALPAEANPSLEASKKPLDKRPKLSFTLIPENAAGDNPVSDGFALEETAAQKLLDAIDDFADTNEKRGNPTIKSPQKKRPSVAVGTSTEEEKDEEKGNADHSNSSSRRSSHADPQHDDEKQAAAPLSHSQSDEEKEDATANEQQQAQKDGVKPQPPKPKQALTEPEKEMLATLGKRLTKVCYDEKNSAPIPQTEIKQEGAASSVLPAEQRKAVFSMSAKSGQENTLAFCRFFDATHDGNSAIKQRIYQCKGKTLDVNDFALYFTDENPIQSLLARFPYPQQNKALLDVIKYIAIRSKKSEYLTWGSSWFGEKYSKPVKLAAAFALMFRLYSGQGINSADDVSMDPMVRGALTQGSLGKIFNSLIQPNQAPASEAVTGNNIPRL